MAQTVAEFYQSFVNELALSKENDAYYKAEDFFTNLMFEYLQEAGEVEEPVICSYRDNGIQINGFEISDDSTRLVLFVSLFNETDGLISIPKSEIAAAQNRALNIYRKAIMNKVESFKKDSDLYDLAQRIYKDREKIINVDIVALVNGTVKDMSIPSQKGFYGTISYNVWDIDRLFKCMTSGQQREPINVDFSHYLGHPLTALKGGESDKTSVYVAIVPGLFLANLYADYRDKLLERNVRAYLQKKSAVNKSVIETIQFQPDMFLAYNNGITVTAAAVETASTDDATNQVLIQKISDFQIVNGGQTTVSLFSTRNDRTFEADFSKVFVQMKLVVVSNDADMDDLVPNISLYSNSQNKTQAADFASNDPYHRGMETLSRSIWTPSKGGKKPIQWFFERARGQYASAMNAEPTPSKRKEFKEHHPLITKTDLAKILYSWDCKPTIVSKGSQKCFQDFMKNMESGDRINPTNQYFEHCVAKTILFRSMEKIVMQQKFGGYKANIVAYTYYKLMLVTQKRIDLDSIWENQEISIALADEIASLSKVIQKYLVVDNNGVNVSEFSKSKKCMDEVEALPYEISEELKSELLDKELKEVFETLPNSSEALTQEDLALVEKAWSISANEWQQLGIWAKENNHLDLWERNALFAMLALKKRKHRPTPDQANMVLELRRKLIELGFVM